MASTSGSTSKTYPALVPRGANEGKAPIRLSRPVWIIGSRKGCHLHLVSSQISQAHCVIVNTGHGLYVKDLASRTHTYVNKRPVVEAVLRDGDKVQIGAFKFFFNDPTARKGDSSRVAEPAILRIAGQTMHLPLTSKGMLIGRKPTCDVPLTEESVSTTHALILDIGGDHPVRDLGSRTGTFLNGQKIHQEELKFGDVIKIGETDFTYEAAPADVEESEAPAALDEIDEIDESDLIAPLTIEAAEPDEAISLSMSLDEPSVSATATPVSEPEPLEPLAVEEDKPAPIALLDDEPAAIEPPPLPELEVSDAIDLEPLPMDLDLLSEEIEEPVLDDEAPEHTAAVEAPAEETPEIKLPGLDDLLDLNDHTNDHADEPHPADVEDTAFHIAHPAEPEPVKPAIAPDIDAPLTVRRGWRTTFEPAAEIEAPSDPALVSDEEPNDAAPTPMTSAADDTEDTEVTTGLELNVLDLSPIDDTPTEPAEPQAAIELPPADDVLEEVAAIEPSAAALPVEAADDQVLSIQEPAEHDEITAGDLELSIDEPAPGELELESTDTFATDANDSAAEEVFGSVDIESLAADALAEIDEQHEAPPPAPVPLTEADVSEPLDLSSPGVEPSPAIFATSETSVPDESALDLSVPADEPSSAPDHADVSATSDVTLPVEELSLAEPEVTDDVIPAAPTAEDVAPLPLPEPEEVFKDEVIDAPPPNKTKPATGRGRKRKVAFEAPVAPPVVELPIEDLKPTKGRRGKQPAKGRRGKLTPDVEESTSPVAEPSVDAPAEQQMEVIESTEPTPESALNLDTVVSVEETLAAEPPAAEPTAEKLSDSVFGRAVEELTGPSLGDLVEPEPRVKSPFEQIVSEASSFVTHDTPTIDAQDDDAFDAMIAEEIAAEEISDEVEVIEHEVEPADAAGPTDEISAEPEMESADEEEELPQLSIDPPMMDEVPETDSEPESAEPVELPIELSEDSVAPLVFDDPTLSMAGLITPGEVSAIATDTIEPLPAMDEIEAVSAIAPDDELVTPQTTAAASEPTIESLPNEPAVQGEDVLAEADVEPLDLTTEPIEQLIPVAPAPLNLSLPSELTLDEPEESPAELPAAETPQAFSMPIASPGFFGISRDAEAFIGGMPLHLPELAPPPPTFGRIAVQFNDTNRTVSHAAPPPPPLMIGVDDDEAADATDNSLVDELHALDDPATAEPVSEFPEIEAPEPPPPAQPLPEESVVQSPVILLPSTPGKVLTGLDLPAPKIDNLRPTLPRPRRNRLADYEKRFADVAEDAALQEMMRSKPAESQPRPPVAPSGFDGLAISPPVREADVFSAGANNETGFLSEAPRAADPFFDEKDPALEQASSRTIAHGHVPPGSRPNVPLDFGDSSLSGGAFSDIPMASRSADPFGMAAKMRSSASPIPNGAPDFRYTGSGRGQRRIGIKVMLVAMVVFMIAAGAGGWLLTPVSSTLRAKVTYTNLAQRSMFDRSQFHVEQESLINDPVVRTQAVVLLKQTSPQTDPGVLADALAFERMTRKLDWPDKTNNLVFDLNSVDPSGDRKRLSALLTAIYNQNNALIDKAKQRKKIYEEAQGVAGDLVAQKNALLAKIRVLNNSDERPSASLIAETEKQASLLSDVWGSAVKNVNDLKDQLIRLKPADNGVINTLPEPGADPEKDAIVLQMREELKGLQDRILAAKPQDAEALSRTRKALDDSLERFQEQLSLTQNGAGNSAELANYIAAAQKLQTMAKQLNSDLIDRQRAQNEKLKNMRQRLDDQVKARQEALYDNDPELKKLNDELSFARRSHNVAMAEGLDAEAGRYQNDIDRLTVALEARKTGLGKDVALEKTIGEIQKLIDDNAKSIATDQQLFQLQMSEVTAVLNAAAPGLAKLPPAQKALADELSKRTGELFDARRTYLAMANASAPQANDDVRKMEADAQLLTQRVSQRVTELKDAAANRRNQNDLDRAAQARKYEEAQSQLAIANKVEADAQTAWLTKQTELSELRTKLNAARADDTTLEDYHRRQQELERKISVAQKDVDEKSVLGTASIVPEPPADDSLSIAEYHDPRWKYASICTMAVVGLFTFLILLGGFHHVPTPAVNRPKMESVDPATKDSEDEPDQPVAV